MRAGPLDLSAREGMGTYMGERKAEVWTLFWLFALKCPLWYWKKRPIEPLETIMKNVKVGYWAKDQNWVL